MKFFKTNYNEFRSYVRWHDYFNLSINEFAIILARRYDFDRLDNSIHTYLFMFFGFTIYKKIKRRHSDISKK